MALDVSVRVSCFAISLCILFFRDFVSASIREIRFLTLGWTRSTSRAKLSTLTKSTVMARHYSAPFMWERKQKQN